MRASGARRTARISIAAHSSQMHEPFVGTTVAKGRIDMLLMDAERFHPSRAVRASISGDGLVLLDVDGGLVLTSNAVGARIWQLLEQDRTAGEIARQLVDDYAVPAERAQRDVVAFVESLLARGLVTGDPR